MLVVISCIIEKPNKNDIGSFNNTGILLISGTLDIITNTICPKIETKKKNIDKKIDCII